MTVKEKKILEAFKTALPKMTDREKERILIMGETIGMVCDSRQEAELNTGQKGA
jgi:hypothetical protein